MNKIFYPEYLPMPGMGEEGEGGGADKSGGSGDTGKGKDDKAADQKQDREAGAEGGKDDGKGKRSYEEIEKALQSSDREASTRRKENEALAADNEKLKKAFESISAVINPDKSKTPEQAAQDAIEDGKKKDSLLLGAKIENAFIREAVKEGIDPARVDRAFKLLDTEKIKYNPATGKVEGMDLAIKDLRKDVPELFGKKTVGDTDTPAPGTGDKTYTDEVKRVAADMGVTPEYAAEIIKKRSEKAGGKKTVAEIFRFPTAMRTRSAGSMTEKE